LCLLWMVLPPSSTLFPYTTLFRSREEEGSDRHGAFSAVGASAFGLAGAVLRSTVGRRASSESRRLGSLSTGYSLGRMRLSASRVRRVQSLCTRFSRATFTVCAFASP